MTCIQHPTLQPNPLATTVLPSAAMRYLPALLLASACMVLPAHAGTVERLIDMLTPGPRTELVITSDNGYRLSARFFGDIQFNDGLTDVVSAKGRATLEETRLGVSRSMVFAPQPDGTLRRTYVVDGRELPLDALGQHWLAETIQKLVREHGVESSARVSQLYAKGGSEAVVAEIEKIKSNHARARYIEGLVKAGPIDEKRMDRLLQAIGTQVESSSFEIRQQLSTLMGARTLTPPQQVWALIAIGRMNSAFDRRSTLSVLAPTLAVDPKVSAAWLGVVSSMRSDFDARTAIEDLMQSPVAAQHIELALQSTLSIRSSFDRSTALHAVLKNMPDPSPAQLAVFLLSAQGVSGEFERSNLLVALINKSTLDATGQAAVRKNAQGMRSEFERTKVLATLGNKAPVDAMTAAR